MSSIRFGSVSPPSPVAVAPEADEAQFWAISISIVSFSPDRNRSLSRTRPYPLACTESSYWPGANFAVSSRLITVTGDPAAGVAGLVSAIGETRAS
ncbi:MAG: hypothetical protein ACRDNH_11075 [Gaiellaceae bacterium]